MPDCLDQHENRVEHQRHDPDECQLRHGERWSRRGAGEVRDDQRKRGQRRQDRERSPRQNGAEPPENHNREGCVRAKATGAGTGRGRTGLHRAPSAFESAPTWRPSGTLSEFRPSWARHVAVDRSLER